MKPRVESRPGKALPRLQLCSSGVVALALLALATLLFVVFSIPYEGAGFDDIDGGLGIADAELGGGSTLGPAGPPILSERLGLELHTVVRLAEDIRLPLRYRSPHIARVIFRLAPGHSPPMIAG